MNTLFIVILKILETYEIEGEKCVKYPTPLARELTEKIKEIHKEPIPPPIQLIKESKIKWRHIPDTSSYIMEFE